MSRFSAFRGGIRLIGRLPFSKKNSAEPINKRMSDPKDWHPADVIAALRKRGFTLAGLSIANEYHPTAAGKALRQSWPAMELIIAKALGLDARAIWPQRYLPDGSPRPRRGR